MTEQSSREVGVSTVRDDVEDLAAAAGLTYVQDGFPGYRRIARGRGFSYQTPDGETVSGDLREELKRLAVPPAWTDVWIGTDAKGHIRATGIDDAGRKQYIYHPAWEEIRDAVKFEQLGVFGRRLRRLRKAVDRDLSQGDDGERHSMALAVALLDETLIRVGNAEYALSNGSYGLTTLTRKHVRRVNGGLRFRFTGKGGAEHEISMDDDRLVALVTASMRSGDDTLLSYEVEGTTRQSTSRDINEYLKEAIGHPITAKVFRTWGASVTVVDWLGRHRDRDAGDEGTLLDAIDTAAERLGNTREVCRSAYVHPVIADSYRDGSLDSAWSRSRRGRWLDRAESALNHILPP